MLSQWSHRAVALAAVATAAVLLAALLAACGGSASPSGEGTSLPPAPPAESGSPPTSAPPTPPEGSDSPSSSKLAPGLYDMEDGSVQAVGTVEYREVEGGFWAVVGGTEAEGDTGAIVAVVVNGDAFADEFKKNEGLSFIVEGRRVEGASTRMAGPEIEAKKVTLAGEAGPAE